MIYYIHEEKKFNNRIIYINNRSINKDNYRSNILYRKNNIYNS